MDNSIVISPVEAILRSVTPLSPWEYKHEIERQRDAAGERGIDDNTLAGMEELARSFVIDPDMQRGLAAAFAAVWYLNLQQWLTEKGIDLHSGASIGAAVGAALRARRKRG